MARVRRPSVLAQVGLVVLIGLVGGAVLACASSARRASTSVDRFLAFSLPEDGSVFAIGDLTNDEAADVLAKVAETPEVRAHVRAAVVVLHARAADRPAGKRAGMVVNVPIDPTGGRMLRRKVVAGRLLDEREPHEAEVDEELARLLDLRPGSHLIIDLYSAALLEDLGNGQKPKSDRGSVDLTVTGIVRSPGDLERSPYSQPGTIEEFNDATLIASPALWDSLPSHDLAAYGIGMLVRLDGGADQLEPWFESLGRDEVLGADDQETLVRPEAIRRAIHIEAASLWALAALIGLVGAVLVGALVRRINTIGEDDWDTLRALGVTRGLVVAGSVVRSAPAVVAGSLFAVVAGALLSPHIHLGTSARAEIDPGQRDAIVLLGGGLLLASLGLAAVAIGGLVALRRPDRGRTRDFTAADRLVTRLASLGARPGLTTGVRMAVPLPGRAGVATRSAVGTIAVSIAMVVATITFGASLQRLVTDPDLRGWTWDVEVGNFSEPDAAEEGRAALEANRDVAGFTGFSSESVSVDGMDLDIVAIEDPAVADVPVMHGRLPTGPGEVAVSPDAFANLGKQLGETVEVAIPGGKDRFELVGVTLGPGAVDPHLDLRRGVMMRFDDFARLLPEDQLIVQRFVVRFAPGVDPVAARQRLGRQFEQTTFGPALTADVKSVASVRPLLLAFGAVLAVLATVSLFYALSSVLRRRQREVAILKALGFDRGQVGVLVLVQSVGLAIAAMVVAVPIGLVAGRWSWRVAARASGALSDPAYPAELVAVVAVVLVVAALAAVGPALRAQRIRAAELLRTE